MIVITGAAGFIGSALVAAFNDMGRKDLVLVDDFNRPKKAANFKDKHYHILVNRLIFSDWLDAHYETVESVYHLGARTDTAEMDKSIFDELNVNYSKMVWLKCARYGLPLVYASSAATYGSGEHGFVDNHEIIHSLQPLNPYGESKNNFDKWALDQSLQPPSWYGLKFFNVYGPNEYHKGRMASVVFHTFNTVTLSGSMSLFRSHRSDVEDGMQSRDFVYIKDVVKMCIHLQENPSADSGLYNIGTGKARSFIDLASATFNAMGKEPMINFIDTPIDIRDKYQYFTEADIRKIRSTGYDPMYSLEAGIEDYVQQYLNPSAIY